MVRFIVMCADILPYELTLVILPCFLKIGRVDLSDLWSHDINNLRPVPSSYPTLVSTMHVLASHHKNWKTGGWLYMTS